MELKCWSPHQGLPSIDTDCLRALSYAKFCGAPVKNTECNNPWVSPNSQLPLFIHGPKVKITTFTGLKAHLEKQNFNADISLTNNQIADTVAYEALLKNKLKPALLYILWCDTRNYIEFVRPWYSKKLPFPLNYFLPGQMQRMAQEVIASLHENNVDLEEEQIETFVYKNAQECLTLLCERLGEKDFFFGKSPCSMDAIVFGYLAPMLKLSEDLPNASLCNYLKACPNLVQFIARILQRYFLHHSATAEGNLPNENQSTNCNKIPTDEVENEDFPHKWRNIFLSGMFSLSAMAFYALVSGIIQISYSSAEDSYNDEEDIPKREKR